MPKIPDSINISTDGEGRQFVFQVDESTPRQVIRALEDFTHFLERFDSKSREYGEGSFFYLGSKGQFSDIYRKIIKLKTALWDGKPEQLTSEGVVEVIHDLIGHLFMTLQCLRQENGPQPPERATPPLGEILARSSAYGRLITDSYPTLRPVDEPEAFKRILEKREKVKLLYPQIGTGSLEARNEESLDWLIGAVEK